MNARFAGLVLASAVAAGAAAGLGFGPGLASADDASPSATAKQDMREQALKDALKGLVADGTLTQAQADKVAATLDEALPRRPHGGGPGHGPGRKLHGVLEDAAAAIGLTVPELRDALRDGKTLAEVAAGKGVSKATLINKLVAAAEARLAQAVENGRITQAQADERKADLREKITGLVDRDLPARGPRPPAPADLPG